MKKIFIFDFDNTFIRCELPVILNRVIISQLPNRNKIWEQISSLVSQGVKGKFNAVKLVQKLNIFNHCRKEHIDLVVEALKNEVTPSFQSNRAFFLENTDNIYIITTNLKEIVYPVVADYGIKEGHVFGNNLLFKEDGFIKGFNPDNPLMQEEGKAFILKNLHLDGEIIVVGDEEVDYKMKLLGGGTKFYAFTENRSNPDVVEIADSEAKSLDDVLSQEGFLRL